MITEPFTAANGTAITAMGTPWAYVEGSGTNGRVQGNAFATESESSVRCARRTDGPFPTTQWAEVVFSVTPHDGEFFGPAVYCQSGTNQFYGLYADADSVFLFRFVFGFSNLGSVSLSPVATDVLRLEVSNDGTDVTLNPKFNGTTIGGLGITVDPGASLLSGDTGICWFNSWITPSDGRVDPWRSIDADAPLPGGRLGSLVGDGGGFAGGPPRGFAAAPLRAPSFREVLRYGRAA